jgi:hypothetical protein
VKLTLQNDKYQPPADGFVAVSHAHFGECESAVGPLLSLPAERQLQSASLGIGGFSPPGDGRENEIHDPAHFENRFQIKE